MLELSSYFRVAPLAYGTARIIAQLQYQNSVKREQISASADIGI
jgi:hypothetical protein